MLEIQRIAVGSANPVKLAAVRSVASVVWPAATVESVEVDSGVRDQPLSDAEMVAGARARALAARARLDADLGVGLEGGVQESTWGCLLTGWVAVADRSGQVGLGSGGRIVLPPVLAAAMEQGQELGPAVDRLTGQRDTRRGPGAVGVLTGGLVAREESFRVATAYALACFLHPQWYSNGSRS